MARKYNNKMSGRKVRSILTGMAIMVMAGVSLMSCKSDKTSIQSMPAGFDKMSDNEKVAYMMKHAKPDSVARFICRAALGDMPGIKIDTLANATLYAYEIYKDDDLQTFSQAYDSFSESLPLDRKMTLRKLAALDDPMALGYQLGLEYVNNIRMDKKNAKTVEAEIASLKKVCAENPEDSATFRRFMKGFEVALVADHGSDVPRAIYDKYAPRPEEEAEDASASDAKANKK